MHSFSAVLVSALLATASGSPVFIARSDTCGVAPSASNTRNQPLSQPTNINTANDCKSQCDAKSGCQSFCFGLVDNAIQCKLFSCDASAIPKQDSANLVAYNKGCSAIPSVVPTQGNPTGKVVDSNKKQSSGNDKVVDTKQKSTQGNKDEPQASPVKQAKATPTPAKPAKSTPTPAKPAKSSPSPVRVQEPKVSPAQPARSSPSPVKPAGSKVTPVGQQQKQTSNNQEKQTSNNQEKQTSNNQEKETTEAKTCGSKPAGNTSNEPISKPTVSSVDACKSKCQADSNCKSFTCGTVNSAFQCQLYNVEAASIPAPTTTAQKSAFRAYDVGCSM